MRFASLRFASAKAEHYIITAGRLIAPSLNKSDWTVGYGWVCDALKVDHENISSRMEVEQALQYLKSKDFDKAIAGERAKRASLEVDEHTSHY